jgi:antitoxin HicB
VSNVDHVPVDEVQVRQLADREYPLLVSRKGERIYVKVPDLPGCSVSAENVDEAMTALVEAKRAWVEMALALGRKVPDPSNQEDADYSGRILVRTGSSLHRRLVEMARQEGISLNQLVNTILAEAIGARRAA